MTRDIEALRQARRVALEAPSDELYDLELVHKHKPCGTAHCQFGWMLGDPWFKEKFPRLCFSLSDRFLGLTTLERDILFAASASSTISLKTGITAKARVIHNIDRLITGNRPIQYDSPRWADIDLSAIYAEIEAFDRAKTEVNP